MGPEFRYGASIWKDKKRLHHFRINYKYSEMEDWKGSVGREKTIIISDLAETWYVDSPAKIFERYHKARSLNYVWLWKLIYEGLQVPKGYVANLLG